MIQINKKSACCGCGACAAACPKQCIALKADSEGFWYPEVNMDACVDCGLCEMHCPELHTEQKLQAEPVAYAVQHRVDEVRGNSSSGGVFYALASEIIHHGGTVFGAAFREDFSVAHCGISDINDLPQLMRSKYVQSEIGAAYREVEALLKNGKQVLFTGTPCQIAGLTGYLGKDYDTLISAAVACHGVPSPRVWKQYLSEQEAEFHSSVTAVNLRNKETGWKHYSVSFTFENGKVYQKPFSEDGYMLSFLLNYNLRPSCYSCKWKGLPPQADLMLADFWGIENVLPEMDHPMGTSLVLAVTEKGKVLLRAVEKNLKMVSVSVEPAVSGNPAILESVKKPGKRDVFWRVIETQSVREAVAAASHRPLWRCAAGKIKRKLKQLLK